jgi:hypothetical protein
MSPPQRDSACSGSIALVPLAQLFLCPRQRPVPRKISPERHLGSLHTSQRREPFGTIVGSPGTCSGANTRRGAKPRTRIVNDVTRCSSRSETLVHTHTCAHRKPQNVTRHFASTGSTPITAATIPVRGWVRRCRAGLRFVPPGVERRVSAVRTLWYLVTSRDVRRLMAPFAAEVPCLLRVLACMSRHVDLPYAVRAYQAGGRHLVANLRGLARGKANWEPLRFEHIFGSNRYQSE